jgi:hypothetical protein
VRFLQLKTLAASLFALVASYAAAQAAVIPVSTYSMQNGDGIEVQGTFNYLDFPYSGGNGTTPAAPLSGGTGLLTDGNATHKSWDFGPTEYVGWKYFDPTIVFNFGSTANIDQLDLYVSGGTGGLVGLPATILVNGNPVSFTTQDWGTPFGYAGVDKLSILFAGGLSASQLSLQLFAGPALADAIAIDPANDPFIIDPRTGQKTTLEPWLMVSEVQFLSAVPEPSTWVMMILGFGALAFISFRKSKASRKLAPV